MQGEIHVERNPEILPGLVVWELGGGGSGVGGVGSECDEGDGRRWESCWWEVAIRVCHLLLAEVLKEGEKARVRARDVGRRVVW